MIRLTADSGHKGLSLTAFLCLQYSTPAVNKAFKLKAVKVDGIRQGREFRLEAGMIVTLHCAMDKKEDLKILFEDELLLAVDKPAGIVSQQNADLSWEQSLEGRICRQTGLPLILVHRLDRETSGCILLAKDRSVFEDMKDLFAGKSVIKEYLTLIKGLPAKEKGCWTNQLSDTSGKKESADTEWQIIEKIPEKGLSLIQAKIGTGRRHQIRLHFSMNGFPVAGDGEYGDFSLNKKLRTEVGLKRQFLHAYRLSFSLRCKSYEIVCGLPQDLNEVLKSCGFNSFMAN